MLQIKFAQPVTPNCIVYYFTFKTSRDGTVDWGSWTPINHTKSFFHTWYGKAVERPALHFRAENRPYCLLFILCSKGHISSFLYCPFPPPPPLSLFSPPLPFPPALLNPFLCYISCFLAVAYLLTCSFGDIFF